MTGRLTRFARMAVGALLCAAALPALAAGPASAAPDDPRYDVLVFSKTAGFRHDSIDEGIAAIRQLGAGNNFSVTATEDANAFTGGNLAQYEVVVFLSTTGDVLNGAQQTAFEGYINNGGGYVGVHAAADTEYDWPWYNGLAGALFHSHPHIQSATVNVEDRAHDATAHLGSTWQRTDEWYNYRTNPRTTAHVLASLNESSYTGGNMSGDHPIAWCKDYQGGRAFYTGGGHTAESYSEAAFTRHLLGGIRWAAEVTEADCRPETGYTSIFNGSNTAGWSQAGPGSFSLSNGTLTSQGGMGLLWYQAREYTDYSLKLDWRLDGDDNSGVFVGFPPSGDPFSAVNNGYEIQIDATDSPDRTTGAIYGFQSANLAVRDAALNPPGEWNTYEIRVEGERLRVYLNGRLINDFTNTDPARSLQQGHIGLQNHGAGDTASFRNVRVQNLDDGGPGPNPNPRTGRITGYGGKCLDVAASNTADGTQIQLYTCNGTGAQTWTLPGDGTVRALGKCAQAAGTGNGSRLQLFTCDGGADQQWAPRADGMLVNPVSNRCADAEGVSSADGTRIHLWDCLGAANQRWVLPT
ncbi:ThuA domain-containing protein [Streptomyces avicenniae]|uniref:ThuA domain-containing protein n=1 Tax=Streptomyces avicenniae TaxID=500153 RepID=UPI00069BB9F1|nr:ThuA domain-containing protein [Streptomyces avicenniae]